MPTSLGVGAGVLFEGDDPLPAYGFMFTTDGDTAQEDISDTAVKLANFSGSGPSSGVTVDYENSEMTIISPGDYQVDAQFSFSGSPSTVFEFTLRVNGELTNVRFDRAIGAGGDVGSGSLAGLLRLAVGDVVAPYIQSHSAGMNEITLIHAQLLIHGF